MNQEMYEKVMRVLGAMGGAGLILIVLGIAVIIWLAVFGIKVM